MKTRALLWPSLLAYAALCLLRRDDLLQTVGRFVLRPYTLWLTDYTPGLVDFMLGPWGYAGDAALVTLLVGLAAGRRKGLQGSWGSAWRTVPWILGGVSLGHWMVLGWIWVRYRG